MALRTKNIFLNMPVKDLNRTVEFFSQLGFEFNPQFTDEKATCMILGDNIYAMLLVESYFQSFTNKEIADSSRSAEMIVAISADNKEQVDEIVSKALAAGGKPYNDPVDHGFMYTWSFQDLDGHLWEVLHMDENASAEQ